MELEDYRPLDEMEQYIDDVLEGRIRACNSVVGSCRRHRKNIREECSDDFPYYFDRDHAEAVCLFYPTFIKHSVGRDVGKPFYLQPWQAFAVASIFGWKRKSDNCRRFTKAYISVGRKNGKSTLAAALCVFGAGFDKNPITDTFESVAQVVLAASKKEQADRVTMAECIRMRAKSKYISSMCDYKNRQITYAHNGGHIITVGSDKAFDGLNPSIVQIDELHAFRSTGNQMEFINTMKTGSGARSQPLFIVTTTAGSTSSEVWKAEWAYATGVATGDFIDESYFSLSYELDEDDDPLDKENWIKANPCLGITLTDEYLEDQAKPARTDKVALNRFTRYHGNRLVSNLDAAFDIDQFDLCAGELSDWADADAIGAGIDLGSRDDLAAFALVARFDTGEEAEDDHGDPIVVYRYEARVWTYLAHDTVRDTSARPFCEFIEEGLIRQTKYPLSDLERDVVEQCAEYGCYDVAFDPYQAQATGERLESEGLSAATMAQTTRYFNEPITELRQLIADGRFTHDGGRLLRWCMQNAVLISDRNDRVMYAKAECSEKIDPVVAMTMALSRAMTAPPRSNGFLTY